MPEREWPAEPKIFTSWPLTEKNLPTSAQKNQTQLQVSCLLRPSGKKKKQSGKQVIKAYPVTQEKKKSQSGFVKVFYQQTQKFIQK